MRPFGGNEKDIENEIANEVRVIEKLSKNGGHINIIPVLKHGWINEDQFYFFDMELCAMNLEDFIIADFTTRLSLQYLKPVCYADVPECLCLFAILVGAVRERPLVDDSQPQEPFGDFLGHHRRAVIGQERTW